MPTVVTNYVWVTKPSGRKIHLAHSTKGLGLCGVRGPYYSSMTSLYLIRAWLHFASTRLDDVCKRCSAQLLKEAGDERVVLDA